MSIEFSPAFDSGRSSLTSGTTPTPGQSAAPPRAVPSPPRANRLRLAILGQSPCDLCTAACCKQNGHTYAARLHDDEIRRFAAFSIDVPIADKDNRLTYARVLPYIHGRCQFLAADDRCTIYDDRPRACRQFQCIDAYNADGLGAHGLFLQRNPRVKDVLDIL
jgi:Putative zinc- or iron-chelating domain